mmetsp:Transcript_7478/g.14179  ORF Transcript_7478/g.14179 Transcript_7478/m.14179 type:complete len:85 (-) Transcript_7478:395-649(-)
MQNPGGQIAGTVTRRSEARDGEGRAPANANVTGATEATKQRVGHIIRVVMTSDETADTTTKTEIGTTVGTVTIAKGTEAMLDYP